MTNRVRSQNELPEYCLHFQFPAKLANHSLTGSGGGCKKDRTAQQIVKRWFKISQILLRRRGGIAGL